MFIKVDFIVTTLADGFGVLVLLVARNASAVISGLYTNEELLEHIWAIVVFI